MINTKTNFIIEWGCFQYISMTFGIKNALAILSQIVVTGFKDFHQKFLAVYINDWTVFEMLNDHIANI